MTLNVSGELLVSRKSHYKFCYNIEYQSTLTLNGRKTWIKVNSVPDVEVIKSSTENNEHNQTSNENKIIEDREKIKLRNFI